MKYSHDNSDKLNDIKDVCVEKSIKILKPVAQEGFKREEFLMRAEGNPWLKPIIILIWS